MTTSHKKWPDDYKQWQGSFDELVETAGEIISNITTETAKPTASIIRHYQQIGAVGRGEKTGRSRIFGFEDLVSVVATKGLVKQGIGLDITSSLVKNASPELLQAYSSSHQPSSAVSLVDSLMADAGILGGQGTYMNAQSNTLLRGVSGSVKPQSLMATTLGAAPTPRQNYFDQISQLGQIKREIQPAKWMTIYYTPSEMEADSQHNRNQVADTLENLAKLLRTPPANS